MDVSNNGIRFQKVCNGVYRVCKVLTGDKDPKVSEVYKICEVSTGNRNPNL